MRTQVNAGSVIESHTSAAATIDAGWLSSARRVPSPNYNHRPDGAVVRLIVLHNISLPPAQIEQDFGGGYIEDFFLNQLDHSKHPYFDIIREMKVSAHVLILRTGEVVQLVSFAERAWHAGRSCYLGVPECNDYSIGIELEGTDDLPFTDAQYSALAQVVHAIQHSYPATINHLTGHSDIAPGRKTDPGRHLDWMRVRASLGPHQG
jgi:AmpD protein